MNRNRGPPAGTGGFANPDAETHADARTDKDGDGAQVGADAHGDGERV